jgi:SNF2 family DNA or RNA helicase
LNNLSVASRVHILEPQWNPSVENQAIGRALRWGQDKRVVVIRYIMEETVEKMIEGGQMRKMQLSLNGGELK